MVDSVKNMASRIDPSQVRPRQPKESISASSSANPSAQVAKPDVELKQAVVKEMSAQPPINLEAVKDIKEAIASGNYPLDIDRISDALMDAFRDLK